MIKYLFLRLELYHNLIVQMDVCKGEAPFEEILGRYSDEPSASHIDSWPVRFLPS